MIPATSFEPGPRSRALAAITAILGILLTHDFAALTALCISCAIILRKQGQFHAYSRFLVRGLLPLAVALGVIWGLVMRGSPATHRGAGMDIGFEYAILISLRVAAFAAVFQAAVLSLTGLRLAAFLGGLGLHPHATAVIVSIFNLWPDFAHRTEQVIAARCARGLMPDRRFLTRASQLPWALRTLFVGSLSTSLDRAARWETEELPERLAAASGTGTRSAASGGLVWCAASAAWFAFALIGMGRFVR